MNGKTSRDNAQEDFIDSPVFKLLQTASLLARPFIDTIGPARDLTLPEWRSLVVLFSKGDLSNTEVAELTGLDAMSVSRALDRLKRNGRVERMRDTVDARRQINRLTTSGKAVYRAVVKLARQRQQAMIEGLGEEEITAFHQTLGKILQHLREKS